MLKKKAINYHGNTVTYNYITSPQLNGVNGSVSDANTYYLSTIHYSSNDRTKYQGDRIVKFKYTARPDPILQTIQSDKCI